MQEQLSFLVLGTQPCFFKVDQTSVVIQGILSKFIQNLLENKNLVCGAMASTKTAVVIQIKFSCLEASVLGPMTYTFPERLRRKMPL